jgi:endonuclease YncB( thermonuclease family)
MKTLSLLFALLLGGAVLFMFLGPWRESDKTTGSADTTQSGPVANPPPAANAPTAAVEAPNRQAPSPALEPSATPPASPAEAPKPEPAESRTHLLPSEQAEAGRSAALDDTAKPTPTQPSETKRYFKVKVRDAGTLEAGLPPAQSVVIRLAGIETHEADETCKKGDGASWPCGAEARAALAHFIRYRAVTCTIPPSPKSKDFSARCSVMGQDLATWLVRQGWAAPEAGANLELTKALDAAKTERLGLWQGD